MRTDYFDDLVPASASKAPKRTPAATVTSDATARAFERARALGYRVIVRGLDAVKPARKDAHKRKATA